MKCNQCGMTIKKIPISGFKFFLPKAVDRLRCQKCGTCYGVSSLAEWSYFLFYNGGFLILFFVFFGFIQDFVDDFYGITFLSFICILLFDYFIAYFLPLEKIKCDFDDNIIN